MYTWVDHYPTTRVDGDRTYNRFNQLYGAVVPRNTVITHDQSEVAETQWFKLDSLREAMAIKPDSYTPALVDIITRHYPA